MHAKTIPILASADFDRTAACYRDLGFTEAGRWPGEYMILRRGEIELHFWLHPGCDPKANLTACYIRFDSASRARELYDEWVAAVPEGARLDPPKQTEYGLLEFALIDPYGNLLRMGG